MYPEQVEMSESSINHTEVFMSNRFFSFTSANRAFFTSMPVYPSGDVALKLHDRVRTTIFPSLCEVLEIDRVRAWGYITTQLLRESGLKKALNFPQDWHGAGNVVEVMEDFINQYSGILSNVAGDVKVDTGISFSCFNCRSGNSLVWIHRFIEESGSVDYTISSRL
jgi:hypothetical protein